MSAESLDPCSCSVNGLVNSVRTTGQLYPACWSLGWATATPEATRVRFKRKTLPFTFSSRWPDEGLRPLALLVSPNSQVSRYSSSIWYARVQSSSVDFRSPRLMRVGKKLLQNPGKVRPAQHRNKLVRHLNRLNNISSPS